MWVRAVILMTMTVLGFSGHLGAMASCTTESPATAGGCTLTYTPYVDPQTGPTSTYFNAIMTTYYYVVDCDFCTVTNALNHNDPPQGEFTAAVTSDMLTITRVACIPSGVATTRGVEQTATTFPPRDNHDAMEIVVPAAKELHDLRVGSSAHLLGRSGNAALINLAAAFSNDIPPDTRQLPGQAQQYLTSIWSAMFALNVADSGLNTTWACAQVQTAEVKYELQQSWLDAEEIKALLCWIAEHGYNFNTTRAELYSTLQAAVYALQVAGDFTTNRTAICDSLDLFYRIGGYLGINTQGFKEYACRNLPSDTPSPSGYYGPTPVIPLIPYPTNSTTSWGHPTPWNPNTTIWPTGGPTSPGHNVSGSAHSTAYTSSRPSSGTSQVSANITLAQPTGAGNSSSLFTTGRGTSHSGTVLPTATGWSTGVTSGTALVTDEPSPTPIHNESTPVHVPFNPQVKAFFPAVEQGTTSRGGWFKRY